MTGWMVYRTFQTNIVKTDRQLESPLQWVHSRNVADKVRNLESQWGSWRFFPSLLFMDEILLFCLHLQHRSTIKVRQTERPRHISRRNRQRISVLNMLGNTSHVNFRQQHAKSITTGWRREGDQQCGINVLPAFSVSAQYDVKPWFCIECEYLPEFAFTS